MVGGKDIVGRLWFPAVLRRGLLRPVALGAGIEAGAVETGDKSRAVAGSYVWLIKDTEDAKGRRVIVYGSLSFGDAIPAADEPGFLDAVRVATDSLKRAFRIQD